MNANEIMKQAKRKANQNISLTTVGLKRKTKNVVIANTNQIN